MIVWIVEHRTGNENVVMHVASTLPRAISWVKENTAKCAEPGKTHWWLISDEIVDDPKTIPSAPTIVRLDQNGNEITDPPKTFPAGCARNSGFPCRCFDTPENGWKSGRSH